MWNSEQGLTCGASGYPAGLSSSRPPVSVRCSPVRTTDPKTGTTGMRAARGSKGDHLGHDSYAIAGSRVTLEKVTTRQNNANTPLADGISHRHIYVRATHHWHTCASVWEHGLHG